MLGSCEWLSFIKLRFVSIRSLAHWLGDQPFDASKSSRDHFLTALFALGEGYHNFYHKFPSDYRNATKWYQYDPTKWRKRPNWIGVYRLASCQFLNGIVHDVTDFSESHPGGLLMLRSVVGKDATAAFNGGVYSHSRVAHNLLATMRVASVRGGRQAPLCAFLVLSIPLSWVASYGLLQPALNLLKSTVPTLKGKLGTLIGAVGVESTYDYVIVGGGTAGNTIGSRLAEAGLSVAIIEAGSSYEIESPLKSTIPAGYNLLVGSDPENVNVPVDWGIVTVPQAGANGRKLHYTQGKCFGGSSALNAMIYQRGTTGSYDQWATLVEDESYKWDNILPLFKKSVQFTPPDTSKRFQNATTLFRPDAFEKDSTGPVQVSYTNYVTPFATWMKAGMEAAGIPVTEDFNSGHILGTQYNPSTINPIDESRSSSDTFISNLPITSKLYIYPDTLVKKIVFNENKQATGVDVETAGQAYHIRAAREVIVCAGAFHSPQILMASGIGPENTLNSLNIPILSNLPGVGQNMWDHPFFAPSYRVNLETETRMAYDKLRYLEQGVEYALEHEGTWTNTQELLGWEKLPTSHRLKFSQSTLDDLSRFPDD
ncbi:GMC oxidoreductase [Aspergillus parasiticus SU-1]|uniref:GMC oxidoreductase n=1 Tax=Aspergillus parasiticus (strain ATCC 56775 / NRRL 5862 / SRRC 143 / SU-1) TaxID=1403190 RepID=A0A0F0I9R9_ASPPU|nr:GMC oxidoreductase [Aspergillus parasiticus SU-1]